MAGSREKQRREDGAERQPEFERCVTSGRFDAANFAGVRQADKSLTIEPNLVGFG